MVHVCPECLSCINHPVAEDEFFCDKCEATWIEPLPTYEQQVMGFNPNSPGWIKLQSLTKDENIILHDMHE